MAPEDTDATTVAEAESSGKGGIKGSPIIKYVIIAAVMIAAGYLVGTFMNKTPGEETGRSQKAHKSTEKHVQVISHPFWLSDLQA